MWGEANAFADYGSKRLQNGILSNTPKKHLFKNSENILIPTKNHSLITGTSKECPKCNEKTNKKRPLEEQADQILELQSRPHRQHYKPKRQAIRGRKADGLKHATTPQWLHTAGISSTQHSEPSPITGSSPPLRSDLGTAANNRRGLRLGWAVMKTLLWEQGTMKSKMGLEVVEG